MSADERGAPVVAGPLAGYGAAFRAHLSRSGYMPRSAGDLMRAMARASRWLEDRGLRAGELTPVLAADLQADVRHAGPVLRFLREAGVVPAASVAGAGPAEAMLAQFRGWLAGERGLSAATVQLLCQAGPQVPGATCPGRWMRRCGSWTPGRSPRSWSATARAVTRSRPRPW